MQPFQCDLQPEIQETHRTTHTGTTTRCRTQRRNQFAHETAAAAPVAHTRYLSSPATATLHGKTQGFVLRLPPQSQPHATFMQPLQCVSQHHVADPHLSTHIATEHMQPFQCDLQPEIEETHRTTHTGTTTRCRTQRKNQFAHETTAAAPVAHTRYLSSPAAATLHGKTQGFVLRLPPQSQPHATFMQPLQCVSQHHLANQHLSTHIATEHDNNHAASCSHSNAICNQRFKKRIERRTQEQPPVAEHRGGTNSRMKRPQPHPSHTRDTFHRRLQPLDTEKHKVSCSGCLPTTKPMQHSCSHSNAICKYKFKKRIERRTQEQPLLQNT